MQPPKQLLAPTIPKNKVKNNENNGLLLKDNGLFPPPPQKKFLLAESQPPHACIIEQSELRFYSVGRNVKLI